MALPKIPAITFLALVVFRIDGMLSVLYRDDFHPSTEADFNKMLSMSGMNKQEWWAYIRKMAEEREQKK